jgi:hypothetical protein
MVAEALPYFTRSRISDTMSMIADHILLPSYCRRPYIPPLVYIIGLVLIIPFIIFFMICTLLREVFGAFIEDYQKFKMERGKGGDKKC